MELISGAFSNIARINQYFIATNHAENIMNELLISPDIKGPMQNSGAFDDGYQWMAMITEHPMPIDPNIAADQVGASPVLLLDLQVDIKWQQRSKPHVFTLKSMRVISNQDFAGTGLSTPRLSTSEQQRTPGTFLSEPANRERLGPGRSRSSRGGRYSGFSEPPE
jgi:hypothetical protein